MYILLFLDSCGYSHAAKDLLDEKNLDYELIIVSYDISSNAKKQYFKVLNKEYLVDKNDQGETIFERKIFKDFFGQDATFPRVYNDTKLIGGYDKLKAKLA